MKYVGIAWCRDFHQQNTLSQGVFHVALWEVNQTTSVFREGTGAIETQLLPFSVAVFTLSPQLKSKCPHCISHLEYIKDQIFRNSRLMRPYFNMYLHANDLLTDPRKIWKCSGVWEVENFRKSSILHPNISTCKLRASSHFCEGARSSHFLALF